MEIYKGKIIRLYRVGNSTAYVFRLENTDLTPVIAFLDYSCESDFMSNVFGSASELKIGKSAYLTFNKLTNRVMTITSEKGDTLLVSAYANGVERVETRNSKYINNELGLTIEEYLNSIKLEIKGKCLKK